MTELLIDLRRNIVPISVKAALLAVLFLIVATVASFAASVSAAMGTAFADEAEVDLFSVVDTLADPEAFYEFRRSPESVGALGAFYDELNASTSVTALSVFDQRVPVEGFRGGDEFDPGYGNELSLTQEYVDESTGSVVEDVRAMQLNRHALEFYDIEVAGGATIDWSAVDYAGGRVPVLLGSEYDGLYGVGEEIVGSLYFRPLTFEVVGILEPGSAVFYKGQMNTYLDTTIVIPYPETLGSIGAVDEDFLGILSFAMVNTDVAAPTGTGMDGVARELRQVSAATGFDEYSLVGVPTYLVQFGLMRQLIVDNRELLAAAMALLATGVACAGAFLSWHVGARRRPVVRTLWSLGWSVVQILRLHRRLWVVEYVLVTGLVVTGLALLPGVGPGALLLTLVLMVGSFVADALVQHRLLLRTVHARPGGAS